VNAPITQQEARRLAAKFCGPAVVMASEPIQSTRVESQQNQSLILGTLKRTPWKTCNELGALLDRHPTTIRKHLTRMKQAGKVTCKTTSRGACSTPTEIWAINGGHPTITTSIRKPGRMPRVDSLRCPFSPRSFRGNGALLNGQYEREGPLFSRTAGWERPYSNSNGRGRYAPTPKEAS